MEKKTRTIELTPQQKQQIRPATSKKDAAAKLTVELLEERVAPVVKFTDLLVSG
jgi:hypothetical protein